MFAEFVRFPSRVHFPPTEAVSSMVLRKIAGVFVALGLSACGFINPQMPEQSVPLPEGFFFSALHAGAQGSLRSDDAWWTSLDDPLLTRLMQEGLEQNLDVQVSLARLAAARAALGATGLPAQTRGDLTASVRASRPEGLDWQTTSALSFDPVFIVDLFGQERFRRENARADLLAAGFETAAIRLAFQLELARAYLDVRYYDTALRIMSDSRDNRAEFLQTIEEQVEAGVASRREVQRATASLLAVRLEISDLELARSESALRLATLVGSGPAEMLARLDDHSRGQPRPKTSVGIGYPAELLRNRPDILSAEARLKAAVARLGVAAADLYPSLQLSGTLRASTTNVIELGPSIRLPVLDRKLREARRQEARARVEEADLLWQQSIRRAIEEVELGLSRANQASEKRALALRYLESSQEGLRLSTETFKLGQTALNDILDAERDVSDARMQRAQAERSYAIAWAQLQIAVGHGWHGVYRVERCCKEGAPYTVLEAAN